MLYGCCVNMITRTENISGIDVIPLLKKVGYDYAELSLSHMCAMTETVFKGFLSELADIGLPVFACNNFFPAEVRLTGPSVNTDSIRRYLDKAFRRAVTLGAKVIVFGSGLARMVPEGFPVGDAKKQLSFLLGLINEYAQEYDITIAIEALRRQECNIVNTYREALDLAEMTNASNIKCLLDYYHLSEEREDISVIRTNMNKLAHIHFAEPRGRVFPGPQNEPEYRNFLLELRRAGYNSRLSFEAYSENYNYDAEIALRLFKGIDKNLE